MEAREIWVLERDEEDYPPGLRDLGDDAPERIYGIGDPGLLNELEPRGAVTVVGARRATSHGAQLAWQLGFDLANAGLLVVSGMAFGCDSAAHDGALSAEQPTVAVLAGGPDMHYPPSKRALHAEICRSGAVISEMEPGTQPMPWMFRARNRIMAALSGLTVVMEGSERSGTRITSTHALELGREVAAFPGRVGARLSALPHELIRDGATLLRDSQDALELVLGVGRETVRRTGPELEPLLREVLEAIEGGAATSDEIALRCALDGGEAAICLARLELLGYVTVDSLGRLQRSSLEAPELDEEEDA